MLGDLVPVERAQVQLLRRAQVAVDVELDDSLAHASPVRSDAELGSLIRVYPDRQQGLVVKGSPVKDRRGPATVTG